MENKVIREFTWEEWEAKDSLGRLEVARGCFLEGEMGVGCPVFVVGEAEGNLGLEREMVGRKGNGLGEGKQMSVLWAIIHPATTFTLHDMGI